MNTLEEILKEIEEAKKESLDPKSRTKRGGDYRIGLAKAYAIVHSKLTDKYGIVGERVKEPCFGCVYFDGDNHEACNGCYERLGLNKIYIKTKTQ